MPEIGCAQVESKARTSRWKNDQEDGREIVSRDSSPAGERGGLSKGLGKHRGHSIEKETWTNTGRVTGCDWKSWRSKMIHTKGLGFWMSVDKALSVCKADRNWSFAVIPSVWWNSRWYWSEVVLSKVKMRAINFSVSVGRLWTVFQDLFNDWKFKSSAHLVNVQTIQCNPTIWQLSPRVLDTSAEPSEGEDKRS